MFYRFCSGEKNFVYFSSLFVRRVVNNLIPGRVDDTDRISRPLEY